VVACDLIIFGSGAPLIYSVTDQFIHVWPPIVRVSIVSLVLVIPGVPAVGECGRGITPPL